MARGFWSLVPSLLPMMEGGREFISPSLSGQFSKMMISRNSYFQVKNIFFAAPGYRFCLYCTGWSRTPLDQKYLPRIFTKKIEMIRKEVSQLLRVAYSSITSPSRHRSSRYQHNDGSQAQGQPRFLHSGYSRISQTSSRA